MGRQAGCGTPHLRPRGPARPGEVCTTPATCYPIGMTTLLAAAALAGSVALAANPAPGTAAPSGPARTVTRVDSGVKPRPPSLLDEASGPVRTKLLAVADAARAHLARPAPRARLATFVDADLKKRFGPLGARQQEVLRAVVLEEVARVLAQPGQEWLAEQFQVEQAAARSSAAVLKGDRGRFGLGAARHQGQALGAGGPAAMPPRAPLRFRPDGTFRIVQVTDTHEGPEGDPRTAAFLAALLDAERPDLVVHTGDLVASELASADDLWRALDHVVRPMEARGIPWLVALGNHDEDHTWKTGVDAAGLLARCRAYPCNRNAPGPEGAALGTCARCCSARPATRRPSPSGRSTPGARRPR